MQKCRHGKTPDQHCSPCDGEWDETETHVYPDDDPDYEFDAER